MGAGLLGPALTLISKSSSASSAAFLADADAPEFLGSVFFGADPPVFSGSGVGCGADEEGAGFAVAWVVSAFLACPVALLEVALLEVALLEGGAVLVGVEGGEAVRGFCVCV
jgi:hypothetical protein